MIKMITEKCQKMPKNGKIFNCNICHFVCCKNSNYMSHLLTPKHQKMVQICQNDKNDNIKMPKNAEKCFQCEKCNRKYKFQSGLSRHKKTENCLQKMSENVFENQHVYYNNENKLHATSCQDDDIIKVLLKEHTEMKNIILEVCKNLKPTTIVNNHTNSHNKTFNLNVFLNETCKDAMNIMDFVDSLKLQLNDLESVGKLGFINGISNIIIKNLKSLDIEKRPVHCSDAKREILYVKDEDKWEKENEENKKIKKAIKHVVNKNIEMIPVWKDHFPDCVYSDSLKSDQYNHIIIEAMGGSGNNDDINENKIIKSIAKEVIIDKNIV